MKGTWVAVQCTTVTSTHPVYYFPIKPAQYGEPKMLGFIAGSCVSFLWSAVICGFLAHLYQYGEQANFEVMDIRGCVSVAHQAESRCDSLSC